MLRMTVKRVILRLAEESHRGSGNVEGDPSLTLRKTVKRVILRLAEESHRGSVNVEGILR